MAIRKITVKAEGKGVKETTKQVDHLGKATDNAVHSASKLDRTNKASAGIAKNTTSAFAKQAQGLGGLVHIYATVAANVFALGAAFDVLKRSADLKILENASVSLSAQLGTNLRSVAHTLKEVTQGALGFKEAMQATNIALAGGIDAKGLEQLTEIATKAAAMTGRSVPDAVNRLTQAVIKAEPELVDEFGIILRVQKATDDYAKSLGKTAKELTTAERSQAILNQVLERGGRITAGIKLEDSVNAFTKLQTSVVEFAQGIIKFFSGPLSVVANMLSENMALLTVGFLTLTSILGKQLFPLFQNFSQSIAATSAARVAGLNAQISKQKESIAFLKEEKLILEASSKTLAKKSAEALKSVGRGGIVTNMKKKEGSFADNLAKTLSTGKLKGEIARLGDELASEFTGPFMLRGKQISKEQAIALTELVARYKAAGGEIAGSLDITRVVDRNIARIQLMATNYSAAMTRMKVVTTEAFALGAADGFVKSIKDIRTNFEIFSTSVGGVETKFSRLRGVVGSVVSLVGGGLTSILKMVPIVGQLLFAWEIISGIVGSIFDIVSVKNESYDKAVKILDEQGKKLEENVVISKKIWENSVGAEKSFEGSVTHIKRMAAAFKDAANASSEVLNAFEEFSNASTWDKFTDFLAEYTVGWDSFREQMEGVLGNQLQDYLLKANSISSEVAKKFGISQILDIEVPLTIRDKLKEVGREYDDIIARDGTELSIGVNDLALATKLFKELNLTVDEQERLFKLLKKANQEATTGLNKNASALERLNSINESTNDSFEQYLTTLNKTTAFSQDIKDLQNAMQAAKDATSSQQLQFIQGNNKLKALGITTWTELKQSLDSYLEVQRTLIEGQEEAAKLEAIRSQISEEIARGDLSRINELTTANTTLSNIRKNQFAAEIAQLEQTALMQESLGTAFGNSLAQSTRAVIAYKKQAFAANEATTKAKENIDIINKLYDQENFTLDNDFGMAITQLESLTGSLEKMQKYLDPKDVENNINVRVAGLSKIAKYEEEYLQSKIEAAKTQAEELKEAKDFNGAKEKQLEAEKLIAEQRAKQVEYLMEALELENQRVDAALKAIDDESIFSDKGMKALGDSLAKEAREFDKQILSVGERFRDGMLNGMDAAIDAFAESFDAWVTGEGDLKDVFADMGRSMLDAMREQSIGLMTDNLKSIGRQMLSNLFPGSGKMFQTKEEQMLRYNELQTQYLAQIAGASGIGGIGGSNKLLELVDTKGVEAVDALDDSAFDLQGSIFGVDDIIGKGGNMFESSFKGFGEIFQKGAIGIANGLNSLMASLSSGGGGSSIFGTLLNAAVGIFTGGIGASLGSATTGMISSTSGVMSLSSGAISGASAIPGFAVAATGGVTGPKSTVPLRTYADGGIARSPQLSLYGEAGPEAFVPLPDGRSIPVTMTAPEGMGGGTQNNVTVNVVYNEAEGSGNTETSATGTSLQDNLNQFSQMISMKVKEELVAQSRPGGLLRR